MFYARCIPHNAVGAAGSTDIYRVRKERDEVVDHYGWYTKHGVVLGWSPIAGKVAVLAIRPQLSDSLEKQVELGFCLGGKHLKSWTTAQLQGLGAEVEQMKPGGRMASFQVRGSEQVCVHYSPKRMTRMANKPDAQNAAIGLRLHTERRRRGV